MDAPEFAIVSSGADLPIFHVDMYQLKNIEQRCNDYSHANSSIENNTNSIHYENNIRLATNLFESERNDNRNSIKVETVDEQYSIINSNATDDESMAVEALRQLGNSTVYNTSTTRIETKTPQDLPLLPCSYCDLQFRNTADLNNHLSICKNNQYICQICNETFDKKVDLSNHLVCHAVDRPHSCRICSTLFIDKKDLLEHMSIHSNNANLNVCQVCSLTFTRSSSLTNHMKIHTYQPGRAILSKVQENVPISETLQESMFVEKNEEKKITLPSISNLAPLNNWNLNYEEYTQDVNLDVAADITIDDAREEKPTAPLEYSKLQNVSLLNNLKPHTCIYCSKHFAREKALLSHLRIHSDGSENYFQCERCDLGFIDELSFSKHLSNCKTSEKLKAIEMDPLEGEVTQKGNHNFMKNKNKHGCVECDKKFSTKQKLYRHMWIHRKKTHSCETCSLNFEKQQDLDAHRLGTHQDASPYICSECGKNFSSRQGLWEHSRIHGTDSSMYKCVECMKTFSSRQGYLIHKRKHNDERPYGCRFCWKAFRDGGTLRKHERIHTGERPHACPLCSKAFNQKVVLREHVRWLHTASIQPNNEGLYECSMCDMTFVEKDELCAHIVKHSDQMASLAKDASKSNIQGRTENVLGKSQTVEKVKTEIVPLTSTGSVNLMNINFDFMNDNNLVLGCDLCGASFLNKVDLAEHVRIHI